MASSAQEEDQNSIVHKGGCFCKAVKFEVRGLPLLSAYCHCTLCQRLTGCPFVASAHFPAARFSWADGTTPDKLESYSVASKPWKFRWRCKACGSQVASNNTKANKWSVWPATWERDADGKIIGWDTIKPTGHIFYETRMLDINDGLGKWTGYEGQSERLG